MICTGTGIAPFRSMVQHIKRENLAHKNIYLIFGCRTRETLLYYTELTALSQSMEGFTYIPVLSREQWEGRSGYVHPFMKSFVPAGRRHTFYICGWKGMIDEAKRGYWKWDTIKRYPSGDLRITPAIYDSPGIIQSQYVVKDLCVINNCLFSIFTNLTGGIYYHKCHCYGCFFHDRVDSCRPGICLHSDPDCQSPQ